MMSNFIKVTYRNLIRHKAYSAINIIGLAVGLAACMMIILWVMDETGYDTHHVNSERIYRIVGDSNAKMSLRFKNAFKSEFSDIEKTVSFDNVRII